MGEPVIDRRQALAGAGGLIVSQIASTAPAAALDWTLSPQDAGLAGDLDARLDKAVADKRVWGVHCVIAMRKGRLALERYFDGPDITRGKPLGEVSFKADTLHDLRSVSKSIVGLLYGIALAKGMVPAPDQPLQNAFPEYADLFADRDRQRLTIHHVLSMTLGTDWDETSIPYSNPANAEIAMDMAPDRYRYVLERPMLRDPGQRWTYCSGATALLARLIENSSGKSLHDFAREVLFDPVGIGPTFWYKGDHGEQIAASGLRMTPRDLARIGQLMLAGGVWDDRVVVPKDWIARSTAPVAVIDEVREYGYHWYLGRRAPFWGASGNGGQQLYVIPQLDLVLAVTAGNYNARDAWMPPVNILRDVVLPAIL